MYILYICMYIHIYIYIERERERVNKNKKTIFGKYFDISLYQFHYLQLHSLKFTFRHLFTFLSF